MKRSFCSALQRHGCCAACAALRRFETSGCARDSARCFASGRPSSREKLLAAPRSPAAIKSDGLEEA
eukprot:4739000-Pleurochrysis_carterae.AAC.1